MFLLVACGSPRRSLPPEPPPQDAGAWDPADAGPPPAGAVDEAFRRVRGTLVEIDRVAADGRVYAAKARCELALTVAADDILDSDRAEAKAALARLAEVCDRRVFPAALREDLATLKRFAREGDGQGVRFLCWKDRDIHERTAGRDGAAAFAQACAEAWSAPLPGTAAPR